MHPFHHLKQSSTGIGGVVLRGWSLLGGNEGTGGCKRVDPAQVAANLALPAPPRRPKKKRKMMMTEMVDHKRRSHDGFVVPSKVSGSLRSQRDNSGEKRLKAGGGAGVGASISTKEKKDKIGERVAKLQQLVSPFGKVLSAPYLQTTVTETVEERECYSLRSRGLCLMPVASTLKIAQSNGADLWAPANSNRKP
ncbi:ethylene-responsive protein related [Musa troglodytarum]|uniref:Ethylene-responsive protein related n=1 Tax=Musa troglodytarum TaxID=320322 RepID=A0A9E7F718_9LILI|nr:ethylene-responsive protein related [Musa troglodytarum]